MVDLELDEGKIKVVIKNDIVIIQEILNEINKSIN